MSWAREKSTNWNHPAHFQYDSADLPFSGDGGYLESGMPLWKISSITEVEKSFCASDQTTRDQFLSPLVKLLSANSRSSENISAFGNDRSSVPPLSNSVSAEERRRMSQSLPATPLSTPYTTPAQTPYSTPAPTPQNSPLLQRKSEMEAVCKAAARCNQRLASEQQPQNMKWFYGFLPLGNDPCRSEIATNQSSKQLVAQCADIALAAAKKQEETKLVSPSSSTSIVPCRRRCAPLVSNRDMNFLAPTSM